MQFTELMGTSSNFVHASLQSVHANAEFQAFNSLLLVGSDAHFPLDTV